MSNKFRGDIFPGSVDVTIYVKMVDSTNGSDKTGVTAVSVIAYYWRQGASTVVQLTISAGASLGAAHADGKWWEVDATNLPGIYRLDLTDACVATGSDWVTLDVVATACKHYQITYNLDPLVVDSSGRVQVQPGSSAGQLDITSGVVKANVTQAAGSTVAAGAIPNAAAGATGGLPVVDSAGGVKLQSGTGANQISLSSGLVKVNDFSTDGISAAAISAAGANKIADAILARTLGSESYATLSSVPTLAQAMFQLLALWSHITSGTTISFKKLDQSTTALTATLSPNAANPTSILRAS